MIWDHIILDVFDRPVMGIKTLLRWRGRAIHLHYMVRPDLPACFHSHPATAIRIVLWGGYVEEMVDGSKRKWRPGMIGRVRPELIHRIDSFLFRRSVSIWFRGKNAHDITLHGNGWKIFKDGREMGRSPKEMGVG